MAARSSAQKDTVFMTFSLCDASISVCHNFSLQSSCLLVSGSWIMIHTSHVGILLLIFNQFSLLLPILWDLCELLFLVTVLSWHSRMSFLVVIHCLLWPARGIHEYGMTIIQFQLLTIICYFWWMLKVVGRQLSHCFIDFANWVQSVNTSETPLNQWILELLIIPCVWSMMSSCGSGPVDAHKLLEVEPLKFGHRRFCGTLNNWIPLTADDRMFL